MFLSDYDLAVQLYSGRNRLDAKEECILGADETATPGIFFHGSPYVNIGRLTPAHNETKGVYFSHASRIAVEMGVRRWGGGGRVYSVELATRNPYFMPPSYLEHGRIGDHDFEAMLCRDVSARGHDAIVTHYSEGMIFEIIALDEAAIVSREEGIGQLQEWPGPGATAIECPPPVFYRVEGLIGPCYAPECVPLFADRKHAAATGKPYRAVVIEGATNPIYCQQIGWRLMDWQHLRHRRVDCLIDPRDGFALATDPDKIMPIDRATHCRIKNLAKRKKGSWLLRNIVGA